MRECWVNVSVIERGHGRHEAILGPCHPDRETAVAVGYLTDYRLHVRLKPEPGQLTAREMLRDHRVAGTLPPGLTQAEWGRMRWHY